MKRKILCLITVVSLLVNSNPISAYAQNTDESPNFDYEVHNLKTGEITYHSFDDLPAINVASSPAYFPNSSNANFEDGISTLQIVGNDDRVRVADTAVSPYGATVHITANWDAGGVSGGSGFMIGPYTVITAAHCVYHEERGLANEVIVIPGKNGVEEPFGRSYSNRIIISNFPSTGSINDDWAIIQIEEPLGMESGWFGLREPGTLLGTSITNTGYPSQTFCPSQNAEGSFMFRATGSINYVYDYGLSFRGAWDATAGNSGGPVYTQYADTGYTVIGILTSGSKNDTAGESYPTAFSRATTITSDLYNLFIQYR